MPTLDALSSVSRRLREPTWALDARAAHLHTFEQLDLPTFSHGFAIGLAPEVSLLLDSDPSLLSQGMKPLDIPTGITLLPLGEALSTGILSKELYTEIFAPARTGDAFDTLLSASINDGLVLHIDDSVALQSPCRIMIPMGDASLFASIILVTGPHSSGTIQIQLKSGTEQLHGMLLHTRIGPHSTFSLELLDDFGQQVSALQNISGTIQEHGALAFTQITTGGSFIRRHSSIHLTGEGASFTRKHAYLSSPASQYELLETVTHNAPRTTSTLVTRGALSGAARCVERAVIAMPHGVIQSHGSEDLKTLLLSDDARISPEPVLEISEDDVTASHAASVGRLQEEVLFYVRSRGLSEDRAKQLLLEGHLSSIDVHSEEGMRLLEKRLSQLF